MPQRSLPWLQEQGSERNTGFHRFPPAETGLSTACRCRYDSMPAFSLSRKVLPPCMQEQQGPRSASVSINQQTQHQPDGVSQNQERRSWICKLLMSQFWSLNIAGVFPVGQHWLWPLLFRTKVWVKGLLPKSSKGSGKSWEIMVSCIRPK